MNAYCERFLGSVRRECLDYVLILGERHLLEMLKEYVRYFAQPASHPPSAIPVTRRLVTDGPIPPPPPYAAHLRTGNRPPPPCAERNHKRAPAHAAAARQFPRMPPLPIRRPAFQ